MIELSNIGKSVREPNGDRRDLFDGLDFRLREDERSVAIAGRSGSGKSTLLRILAGLDNDYEGDYLYRGERLRSDPSSLAAFRMRNIGIVTQSYDLLRDRDVLRNVMFGAGTRRADAEWAQRCLAAVHLDGFERRRVGQLSGGEAQRVAIARALVKRPAVILADEPTGALDEENEDAILGLFAELQESGTKLVVATHSPRVMQSCDRTLVVHDHGLLPAAAAVSR